ncbi:MAG: GAF domain-containing protein [Rubrivivax sp.]|nr:MAG: GAF domain-containing protein [Rubrivivax sp.]
MRIDTKRLSALHDLRILGTAPEADYDALTRDLAQCFDVPIGMVNLLDAERDWFKSCMGLPFDESPANTSFCEVFFSSHEDVIVVEDTTQDQRFSAHPLVLGAPHVRFYAATRLVVEGHTVGTLCVYDIGAKTVTPAQVERLQDLGHLAMALLQRRQSSVAATTATA